MKLVIGNKNYSSWSLRAWLMLSVFEIEFEEVTIYLGKPETSSQIRKYNKAGKVPVLHDEDLVVWDSIAICEYISEAYLQNRGWPEDAKARATARSCCAEMHSGFFELREQLPMNCRASDRKVPMTPKLQQEIERIDGLWSSLRKIYNKGDFLFGDFSIADCMFAPVAFRFATYGITLSNLSEDYMKNLLAHPKMQLWLKQAQEEQEIIGGVEVGI